VAIQYAAEQAVEGHVSGIDYSEALIQIARKPNASAIRTGRVDLTYGDSSHLPYEDEAFDRALTIHCIYFGPNQQRVCARFGGLPEQGWIIEMVAYNVSVNGVFFSGADFDHRPSLGTVGRSRYVKLKTLEEAQGSMMRRWIEHAGRVRGWK
jgi:hypothetical protein